MNMFLIIIAFWVICAVINLACIMIEFIKNPSSTTNEDGGMLAALYVFATILSPVVFCCIMISYIKRLWRIIQK